MADTLRAVADHIGTGRDADTTNHEGRSLRASWPLQWRDVGALVLVWATLCAAWSLLGWALTGPLEDSAIVRADGEVSSWLEARRTETWTTLAEIGSGLAETLVKIVATAVIAGVMLAVWRRWLEPLVIAIALILEAAAFITITWIVARPRPQVSRLQDSPVDSSFPSGHVAAAVAYAAITVVLLWHVRRHWIRTILVLLTVLVPIAVGASRLYLGMHYLTDVIAGALLGAASVVATLFIVVRASERRHPERDAIT